MGRESSITSDLLDMSYPNPRLQISANLSQFWQIYGKMGCYHGRQVGELIKNDRAIATANKINSGPIEWDLLVWF